MSQLFSPHPSRLRRTCAKNGMNRGIRVPQDLSLVCLNDDPYFKQCRPSVSHIRWSSRLVVNRIVRWANTVSQRKEDTRQTSVKAEFIEGGTIGPVPVKK